MDYVSQTMTSTDVGISIEVPPTLRNKKVHVIILPVEDDIGTVKEPQANKLKLGFMPGPPLPDSFFDPMPEDDLQAWEGKYSWEG